MHKQAASFTTRLGCDNCGHADVYEIPVRRQITSYNPEAENSFSFYARPNGEGEIILLCEFCKLPQLQVLWFKEELILAGGL